jgi:probable F420-dependent oxidoreductase
MRMSNPRRFRFAVQSFSAQSAKEWRERARRAEELGYSTLHLADHILGPGEALASTNHPVQELAAVPAMAMAAEATSTLRIGTLDLLSEGRLELGLGAGWIRAEYEATNIPFDPALVRIERLAETLTAIRAHMGDASIEIDGKHVHLHGFEGAPKPVQRPHPPIMIGGGSKRILQLAGREADIVSFNFNNRAGVIGPDGVQTSTAEKTLRKVEWVREAAGARFADVELEIALYFAFVGDGTAAVAQGMAANFGLSPEEMARHPHATFGSVDEICAELEQRRETYGISYFTVGDGAMEAFAPVVNRLAGA